VFLSLLWHNVQLGFGWVIGQNMCFKWFHVYCAHHNLRVWTICAWDVPGVFQKKLEILWLICSLNNHFSTFKKLSLASSDSIFLCSLLRNVC
jgi:hypothetical protein